MENASVGDATPVRLLPRGTGRWIERKPMASKSEDRSPRVDRSAFSVVRLEDDDGLEYWLTRSTRERLEAVEIQRRVIYGYGSTPPRLQRLLEVS